MSAIRSKFTINASHILAIAPFLILGLVLLIPSTQSFLKEAWLALSSNNPKITEDFITKLGWAGPLAIIAGFILQTVIPVIPSLALIIVTSKAYGLVNGFFIVYLGIVIGAAAGYWLGRTAGDPLVKILVGETMRQKAYDFTKEHGSKSILLIRMMPILSADAMSLVAGAARMPFYSFMLSTLIGSVPVTALVVWLSSDSQRLFMGVVGMSILAAVFALIHWLYKKRL